MINSPSSSSGISSASSSPSASEQRLIREMEQERLARKAVEERLARVEDELARIHETYRTSISETKRKLWVTITLLCVLLLKYRDFLINFYIVLLIF